MYAELLKITLAPKNAFGFVENSVHKKKSLPSFVSEMIADNHLWPRAMASA